MSEPVLVDSTLHRAFTILYGIYIATAVIAVFSIPPSLEAVGGKLITDLWIVAIGITAVFAFASSLKEKWQRREMGSASVLVGLLAIYSIAVLINSGVNPSLDRFLVGVFSLSYSVFPAWRVQFFFRKLRKPRG